MTAYEIENAKLDVVRDGRTQEIWIDKPTIYNSLGLMEGQGQVALKDRKVCRGGRVRKKYVVTPKGLLGLLWGDPEFIELPKPYIRNLAKVRRDFFPTVFDLWPEFVKENLEQLAWDCLKLATKIASGRANEMPHMFFDNISYYLRNPKTANKDWLQVIGRNEAIRQALVTSTLDSLAQNMNAATEILRLLPSYSCKTDSAVFTRAMADFIDSAARVDREMKEYADARREAGFGIPQ